MTSQHYVTYHVIVWISIWSCICCFDFISLNFYL